MSLYSAIRAGVSGIFANATAIGHISDNIANSSTVGYKRISTRFTTFITQRTTGISYSAGGVRALGFQANDQQGVLQGTNAATDLAISGGGYFVVTDQIQRQEDGSFRQTGGTFYTRAGQFQADQDGNLRNTDGYYLLAWTPRSGSEEFDQSSRLSQLEIVNVSSGILDPQPTTELKLESVLPQDAMGGQRFSTEIDIFDKKGVTRALSLTFVRAETVDGEAYNTVDGYSEWRVLASVGIDNRDAGFFNSANIVGSDNVGHNATSNPLGEVQVATIRFDAYGRLVEIEEPERPEAFQTSLNVDNNLSGNNEALDVDGDGVDDVRVALRYGAPGMSEDLVNGRRIDVDGDGDFDAVHFEIDEDTLTLVGAGNERTAFYADDVSDLAFVDAMAAMALNLAEQENGTRVDLAVTPGALFAIDVDNAILFDTDNNGIVDTLRINYNLDKDGDGEGDSVASHLVAEGTIVAPGEEVSDLFAAGGVGVLGTVVDAERIHAIQHGDTTITANPEFGLGTIQLVRDAAAGDNLILSNVRKVDQFFDGMGILNDPDPAVFDDTRFFYHTRIEVRNTDEFYLDGQRVALVEANGVLLTDLRIPAGAMVGTRYINNYQLALWDPATGMVGNIVAGNVALFDSGDTPDNIFDTIVFDVIAGAVADGTAVAPDAMAVGGAMDQDPYDVNEIGAFSNFQLVDFNGDDIIDDLAILLDNETNLDLAIHPDLRIADDTNAAIQLNGRGQRLVAETPVNVLLDIDNDGVYDQNQAQLVDTDGDNIADALVGVFLRNQNGRYQLAQNDELVAPNDQNGHAVARVQGGISGSYPSRTVNLGIDYDDDQDTNGLDSDRVILSLDLGSQFARSTQSGGADGVREVGSAAGFQLLNRTRNGRSFALVESIRVHQDGQAEAFFDNGDTARLYKIPLVSFENDNGLESRSGNVYLATDLSGEPLLRAAGTGGVGVIQSEAVEGSAVDLGEEFANIIIAQQAYTASSRIISTSDELLQELVRNLR